MNKIFQNPNRINWIDELKGFILILVCLGHTNINIPFWGGGNLIVVCVAFRMSTFFFLSGLLFSTRRYSDIDSYIKHKTKVLLIPYILLSLLFSILDPRLYDLSLIEKHSYINSFISSSDINTNIDFLIYEFISIFYWGIPITAGPLWFVITLYFVSILFYIIHNIFKSNIIIIVVYAVVCLIIGWLLNLYTLYLPYCFSTVFTASFFFSLGFLTKNRIKYLGAINKVKLSIIIIFLMLIYIYAININGGISLTFNKLGNSFWGYILSTVSGIFLIISIFIFINKFINNSIMQGVLKNIARNALIVLSVHYWVIICCKIFLYSIAKETYFPWLVTLIMITITTLAIPLFRTKLYMLIGKNKISFKESLSIK